MHVFTKVDTLWWFPIQTSIRAVITPFAGEQISFKIVGNFYIEQTKFNNDNMVLFTESEDGYTMFNRCRGILLHSTIHSRLLMEYLWWMKPINPFTVNRLWERVRFINEGTKLQLAPSDIIVLRLSWTSFVAGDLANRGFECFLR